MCANHNIYSTLAQDWDGQIYRDSLTGLERPEDDLIGWFIGLQCF